MLRGRITLLRGLLAVGAWLLVAAPLGFLMERLPPQRYEYGLPRVCLPYTPGTDVVSLVPDLFSALFIAAICVFLVEPAKAQVAAVRRRSGLLYALLTGYQFTLVLDVLREYAWDWYGYILYFGRLINLSYEQARPEVLPVPTPWLSLLALLVCVGTIAFVGRCRSLEERA